MEVFDGTIRLHLLLRHEQKTGGRLLTDLPDPAPGSACGRRRPAPGASFGPAAPTSGSRSPTPSSRRDDARRPCARRHAPPRGPRTVEREQGVAGKAPCWPHQADHRPLPFGSSRTIRAATCSSSRLARLLDALARRRRSLHRAAASPTVELDPVKWLGEVLSTPPRCGAGGVGRSSSRAMLEALPTIEEAFDVSSSTPRRTTTRHCSSSPARWLKPGGVVRRRQCALAQETLGAYSWARQEDPSLASDDSAARPGS